MCNSKLAMMCMEWTVEMCCAENSVMTMLLYLQRGLCLASRNAHGWSGLSKEVGEASYHLTDRQSQHLHCNGAEVIS